VTDAVERKMVKIVQELIADVEDKSNITPVLISEKIELALLLNPRWAEGLNRDAVTDELIRRFSVHIGADTTLVSNEGHIPWLDSARKHQWRYWQRYRELLERDLSWDIADKLDRSTDKILGMLEDPLRGGSWSRRGLVVGHVQSGKTASYTGLVCKAADAQYKVIIVLAGLHNNLRSQTQVRLEEGFLGYVTSGTAEMLGRTGVGEIDKDMSIKPNCATTRANNGDFGGRAAQQLSISPEQRPWLFVVKKNKAVLVRLLKWIQQHVADTPIPDDELDHAGHDPLPRVRRRVHAFPLLVIDDEADNASVDTGETVLNENGTANDQHEPTTINRLIRRLLHSFSRSAYVGYTATPFANIFIHERGETKAEGPDLFPSAFIQNLAAPSNYVGPATVFGIPSLEGRTGQLPLIHEVSDYQKEDGSGWMPAKHKPTHVPAWSTTESLPPSLREAVDSFVLACAIRVLRGQGNKHCSMLVHVTRFKDVQAAVHDGVEAYVKNLRQKITRRIGHDEAVAALRKLWLEDFLPATGKVRLAGIAEIPEGDPDWTEIEAVLPDVLHDIDVRTINGTAGDVLDYEENRDKGLKVIAIGGDKLARGLTLEGLSTSYFLRASRMYDTLMQMGRWFGYRPGYLDLCRLYTSSDLVGWFKHISDAAAELREEFEVMANSRATPREYGLKIQSHSELMITSQLKMRAGKRLLLSYSGQLLQTVSLPADKVVLEANLEAAKCLVAAMGQPAEGGTIERQHGAITLKWNGHVWKDVNESMVEDFLLSYETTPDARRVNSKVLAQFIRKMAASGELTHWTVALLGLPATGPARPVELAPSISVGMVKRSARYSIGVLLDPKDELLALDQPQWQAALELTIRTWEARKEQTGEPPVMPSGIAGRTIRGFGVDGVAADPAQGLLVLYVLDAEKAAPDSNALKGLPGVVAFGISFPGSKSDNKVEYMVNNVGWESVNDGAD
jgi:hypothetical protein